MRDCHNIEVMLYSQTEVSSQSFEEWKFLINIRSIITWHLLYSICLACGRVMHKHQILAYDIRLWQGFQPHDAIKNISLDQQLDRSVWFHASKEEWYRSAELLHRWWPAWRKFYEASRTCKRDNLKSGRKCEVIRRGGPWIGIINYGRVWGSQSRRWRSGLGDGATAIQPWRILQSVQRKYDKDCATNKAIFRPRL